MSLKNAGISGLSFEGRGERIAREFYIPVLRQSVAYDRATGYFSVEALVHAANGVAGLINNGGRMRLILGAHDVPRELCARRKDISRFSGYNCIIQRT